MKIQKLVAENFKALEQIALNKPSSVNVIVGPNAVGKSTLLEVVRLPKSILVPRIANESQQALLGMSVLNPQNPSIAGPGMDFGALAAVPGRPSRLMFEFTLTDIEVQFLRQSVEQVGLLSLQHELARPDTDNVLTFTQFLSTPSGRSKLDKLTQEAREKLEGVTKSTVFSLDLRMSAIERSMYGQDLFSQIVLTVLDRGMPFQRTLFSLFPADRAFPQGEQPIQIGTADAQQHLLSHLAQPGLKYARLKQLILQMLLIIPNGAQAIEDEFNLIFDNLLPGKRLKGIQINDFGLVKVLVHDEKSNKDFDIDFMSSGEKGLLLTFLFLRFSMQDGGIVLLDEPELHLNSAVCEKILPFLIDHCVVPKDIQVFICTHSPELVRQAFERDDCCLFHLRSGVDLTPVLRQDQSELFEIFNRLGSSPADVLFTKGGIYVEGVDDALILSTGYPDIIAGFKITPLGGRGEVEREVPALQDQEAKGNLSKIQLFILDSDRNVTSLKSTKMVMVRQLKRYCIENYLLDDEIIFDLIAQHGTAPIESRGKFPEVIRNLAFNQIDEIAISDVYDEMKPAVTALRKEDFKGKTLSEMSEFLAERIGVLAKEVDSFVAEDWSREFIDRANSKIADLQQQWSGSWKEQASGKLIFDNLYKKYQISMKKSEFKKQIIERMARNQTDEWRILRDLITSGLGASSS